MPTNDYYMCAAVTPRRGESRLIAVVFDEEGDLVSDWDESPDFEAGQRFSETPDVPAHKAEVWIGELRQIH